MIEFESVSKTFRDGTTAVDNLSLVVPSGQITVIVGPSGCGKTTTLRMVNRMLEPSKGKVTWDGKPIKSRRKTTLRRKMGYVIQSGGLFPHRTVLENIATVPDLLRWEKPKSRKRAVELLGSVGLDRKLGNRYPAQLSGGQQQRVGVARALAADPLVLLMDEPFSAVDPVVRGELHEFFLGLQRQLSKTIIMITHDIDEAIKLGDQVAILRVGGRLAQVGTPQQLLDEPADAFVEGFVGKDRGYRSLSFQPASGLALGDVQVVRDAGYAGGDGPVLVVDGDAQPVGWADPARPGAQIALGATFDPESDSLRSALDAALTSPVGLAVAVTGDPRRYAGVVDADMILRQVTQTRAQIAESIAVRTHDAPAPDQTTPAVPDTQYAAEDPEATSVRGVPPVASVATVAPVAAETYETAPDTYEDPDATRISGPLPPDPAAPQQLEPTPESAVAEPYQQVSYPAEESAPGSSAGEELPPESLPADDPAPEPYGAEAPSTEDETVATAYDAQLAADDVLTEDEWRTAATDPVEQPVSDETVVQPSVEHPGSDETVIQPVADSDDHDREPPR